MHLLEQVPPYQHAQRIERYTRTLNDRMRSVLDTLIFYLTLKLYGELLSSVVLKHNDLPTSNHPTKTPKIVFGGGKLDLRETHLVPFGTLCMFHRPGNENLEKMDARSQLGVSLGPSRRSRQCTRAYIFETERVVVRGRYDVCDALTFGFNWILRNPTNTYKKSNKMAVATNEFQAISKLVISEPYNLIANSEVPIDTHETEELFGESSSSKEVEQIDENQEVDNFDIQLDRNDEIHRRSYLENKKISTMLKTNSTASHENLKTPSIVQTKNLKNKPSKRKAKRGEDLETNKSSRKSKLTSPHNNQNNSNPENVIPMVSYKDVSSIKTSITNNFNLYPERESTGEIEYVENDDDIDTPLIA